jgi:ribosome-associated protein
MDDTQQNDAAAAATVSAAASAIAPAVASAVTEADDMARMFGELLALHNGGDVTLIDLRRLGMWADYFIVATVASGTHRESLARQVKEEAEKHGLAALKRSSGIRKPRGADADEWTIIDFGGIVLHLMSEKSRAFYDLERLWSPGEIRKIG